ncbi:hypothetical protein NBRC116592_35200 [Colwellia sp. KU-HH00111]|uniref:hypothetical protein n=1 Tax=Colwellia sp. KU-HH00111 TaxID=3127652 RepID=UPI00310A3184
MEIGFKFYGYLAKLINGKKVKIFSDAVLLIATAYLMLKKAFGFSISGWLLNNVFHQSGVNVYVVVSAVILIAAVLIKIISLVVEYFPPMKHNNVEPEEISDCIQAMNMEILGHLTKCDGSNIVQINHMTEQHSFDLNIRLVVNALAEHIRKSIDSIKIKKKDLFISLYSFDRDKNALVYELHYDHKRDLVKSKVLGLGDSKFSDYESVKCFLSSNNTSYLTSKKQYAKGGNTKRYKSVKHYMGCKLETNGYDFGFLNIEFHNNSIFVDEDAMQDFMEESVLPFKLLLEYQYLKRDFFHKFNNFNEYWRVA